MKQFKHLILPLIIFAVVCTLELSKKELRTGDIAFYSFNASDPDGFSIITLVNISPGSTIYFTDSEWNGNRFNKGENHIIWKTGETSIKAGTIVNFDAIKTDPKVSYGEILNTLALNQTGDALFAYTGSIQMPELFIAAASNNSRQFGTLVNTNLKEGSTAITYPEGTLAAQFIGDLQGNREDLIHALNDMTNYKIQRRSLALDTKLAVSHQ